MSLHPLFPFLNKGLISPVFFGAARIFFVQFKGLQLPKLSRFCLADFA